MENQVNTPRASFDTPQLYELLEENEVVCKAAGNLFFTSEENPNCSLLHCGMQDKTNTASYYSNTQKHIAQTLPSHTACFPSSQIFAVKVHFSLLLTLSPTKMIQVKDTAHNRNAKRASKYNVGRRNQASLITF